MGTALALAAAAGLLYASVAGLWWIHDDFYHLRYLLTHRAGWYLFDAAGFRDFPAKVFTPLLFLSLDVDRRLFGLDPGPFYLHHLLVFALCPAVLYGVLRLWLPRLWAAAGAGVFLLGPAASSLAPLLMVRHYVEAILLGALAVAAWAKGRPWISALLYFLACMAKEIAVPLVALLPLLPDPAGSRPTEQLRKALPHGVALILYLGLRYAALGTFAGGYGFTADLPGLALALPGKIGMELVGGRFSWAAVVLCASLAAGLPALRSRAIFLAVLALLLAVLPVLPVSTRMEPRYAVAAWLVIAVAFAAGGRALEERSRKTALAVAAVALASGLWLNRLDWNVRFAQVERMSAENRFLLEMGAEDVLRQPATLAASLKELAWMRENAFGRPPGGSWFQDDLYLCVHRDLPGRIWGYDPAARRVVDLTAQLPSLRARHCSSVRSSAPLRADFRVSEGNLLWELGPYTEGRYRFLLGDGAEAFEMPRSAGFQVAGLPELPLRIGYESPGGWTTYSPELRVKIQEGTSVRWSRPSRASRPKLTPCRLPGVDREARCGTYEVYENRAAGSGRKIPLRVAVIPAAGKPVQPDPLVFFEGGPGASSIESAPDIVEEYGAVLKHRDLLLVDARGTGGSHPLHCPQPEGVQGVEVALDTFMDPAAVRRCREILGKDNDLTQYTTETIVDDAEEVRSALGYPRVNIAGASYGTRVVQVYLRRHPGSVRTAQLSSVVPMDSRLPTFLAPYTQAAFEQVARDCAAEPPCRAAFPDPRADLETVLKRLEAEPARVAVQDGDGKATTLRLTRNGAVQTVRYLLYRPSGVQYVPLLLRRAAAGDLEPLAQTAYDLASALLAHPPDGLYLSVTCAEDVAFVDREKAERLAKGTFVGDLRIRQQLAACANWTYAKIPPSFLEPVRSDVPALIVTGDNDAATPREGAEKVAGALSRGRVLVVPGGTHTVYGLEGTGCIDRLIADFIERGTPEGLDFESCRKAIRRPPFALTLQ